MKLSLISSFALIGSILATPVIIEKRGAVSSIQTIVDVLKASVTANLKTINDLVADVKKNADASLAVVTQVADNLDDIKTALQTAATDIKTATTNALGGVSLVVLGLTQAQIDQLTASVEEAKGIIDDISATVALLVANLTPAALALLSDDIDAVKAALAPFTTPLTDFANAVRSPAEDAVTALRNAATALAGVVTALILNLIGGLLGP